MQHIHTILVDQVKLEPFQVQNGQDQLNVDFSALSQVLWNNTVALRIQDIIWLT